MQQYYDFIGDVHGCAETLKALLENLGYQKHSTCYKHKSRKAIFLGDLIDGGPKQAETVEIVRDMQIHEQALCIMGNHEFNAIAFHTPSRSHSQTLPANTGTDAPLHQSAQNISTPEADAHETQYLRARSARHRRQHRAFLLEHENNPILWADTIDWFKRLPLWIDAEGFRVIHACWDPISFQHLQQYPTQGQYLSENLLIDGTQKDHKTFKAVETLLKGKEIELPENIAFLDRYNTERHKMRVRWWDDSADTLHKAFLGPEEWSAQIPHDPIDSEIFRPYDQSNKPVFFGHYWRSGTPRPLAPNLACLDYSVAREGGQLVAYRWAGEKILDSANFIAQTRIDEANPTPQ